MRLLAALLLMLWASVALAIDPSEQLDDPVLEERARDISAGLRCPVCTSESIDESTAPVARELRMLVRERLLAGDTDEEVLAFIVARYDEEVLLRPTTDGANIILWLAGPAMLLAGIGFGWAAIRRRPETPDSDLTAEEEARLNEILER